ncbi:hypothetical protein K493DRAFT_315350 [Basidiobolus meristosporus CBS 931.73]|uniref:Uncharacterized protein n=1 Tax=Basidiobolus meristosporus CBS 931.73 TaxID=1314790 RepID=A0A1Y1YA08_9FUNG|nr:hypothetical protein K493DRAFT_315350 [Basidiobolus meristosporus CBS 931.73]|eukprot:ORX94735.1 hypothetical protein K493DRAFT_315350 [Basidiobolus meristosporus CBS 931.73]
MSLPPTILQDAHKFYSLIQSRNPDTPSHNSGMMDFHDEETSHSRHEIPEEHWSRRFQSGEIYQIAQIYYGDRKSGRSERRVRKTLTRYLDFSEDERVVRKTLLRKFAAI